MPARKGILAAGNFIVDHVKIIDAYPRQDSLANIRQESSAGGGSPYNILKNLALLGSPFPLEAAGLVGDDANGQRIRRDCRQHGIDDRQLHATTDALTSYTDVMTVESTGRRTFFHQRGANALFDAHHLDLATSRAKIFHLGFLLLLDRLDEVQKDGTTAASRLLSEARRQGFQTSVDLVSEDSDRFQSVVPPAMSHTDYLVINEFEAEKTTGIHLVQDGPPSGSALMQALSKLCEGGIHRWAVIHYPQGAMARSASGEVIEQGAVQVPVKRIIGTVGAGDAFAAGLLFGLHEAWDMQRCLRLAVCTAAASLFHETTTGGLRPLEDCLRIGDEFGFL